jgi:hypothetical protein
MLSKKNILIASLIGFLSAFAFHYAGVFACSTNDFSCTGVFNNLAIELFIFLPVLVFSLITYLMRREVFRIWAIFSILWLPLYFLIIYLTPNDGGGGGFGPQISITARGLSFVSLFFAYCLLSAVLIFGTYMYLWFQKK